MSHRALVAYERPDGRFDVHTSRLGGLDCRLARSITPSDPYASGDVDPAPNVVARPFEHVLTMVDLARHEAVYRVGAEYDVETYLPLWFGFEHYLGERPTTGDNQGVIVAVDGPDEAAELRRWLRAAKGVLATAISDGALDVVGAQTILDRAVRQHFDGEVLDPRRRDR
ncbi:DUF6735 family protein [Halapricum desulfuricans]|uniref:Uncharacterized protein n=1 Tax=Halapricum desulfuricans TaxID=2841257 RepID=A0A897N1N8_9EURY|nr:DUF6735 family protein [Halapricum desulfuricans]QSG06128.1 Uncharacterized protein HSR121_1793 [Halapricum desulfuricans]